MMRFALALLSVILPLAMAGSDATDERIMEKIDLVNLYTSCWGEAAMDAYAKALMEACEECGLDTGAGLPQEVAAVSKLAPSHQQLHAYPSSTVYRYATPMAYTSPYVNLYGRRRREANVGGVTQSEVNKFLASFREYQGMNQEKMEGLRCVLTKLQVLDSYGNVDLNNYLKSYEPSAYGSNALADPEFMSKARTSFQDCYAVSQNWPQQMLDRHEMTKAFGRQYIFFQCAKKIEERMCYMYSAKKMIDKYFGNMDHVDHAAYGFPADKYEAAYTSVRAMVETSSPAMTFVDKFLFSKAKFL